jgi:uncharacterized hydrophobic protein (TIGR00271 family)
VVSIEVYGESDEMRRVVELLEGSEGVRRVIVVDAARTGHALVRAHATPGAVPPVLDGVRAIGVPDADVTVERLELVRWALPRRQTMKLEWADVIGTAHANVQLTGLYLAFMFAAGVIGCYGITDTNGILIVGAMAISPDLLPIVAIGVGLVARSSVALRGLGALALGMAAAVAAAVAFSFLQDTLGLLPSDFNIDATVLGGLTTVNDETIVVAFAAGAAGMLALETRAMTAVGVAISVTTIPAAAYLGVSIGVGELGNAPGALAVLGMNAVMMSTGAASALLAQRLLQRRGTVAEASAGE